MDAGQLVVGRRAGLVLALERLEPQDQQVVLVGEIALEVAELAAEGDGAWAYQFWLVMGEGRAWGCGWGWSNAPSVPGVVGIPVMAMLPLIAIFSMLGVYYCVRLGLPDRISLN